MKNRDTIPTVPGRTYKAWSKYWNAACITVFLYALIFSYFDVTDETVGYIIAICMVLPFTAAFLWKPLVKEVHLSPSTAKIIYDNGAIDHVALASCRWLLLQEKRGTGKAYRYKLKLVQTVLVQQYPDEAFDSFEIKKSFIVCYTFTPAKLREFVQSVHMMSNLQIPIIFENEQMRQDYNNGIFVDLKKLNKKI